MEEVRFRAQMYEKGNSHAAEPEGKGADPYQALYFSKIHNTFSEFLNCMIFV
jgi:hypothetical protein